MDLVTECLYDIARDQDMLLSNGHFILNEQALFEAELIDVQVGTGATVIVNGEKVQMGKANMLKPELSKIERQALAKLNDGIPTLLGRNKRGDVVAINQKADKAPEISMLKIDGRKVQRSKGILTKNGASLKMKKATWGGAREKVRDDDKRGGVRFKTSDDDKRGGKRAGAGRPRKIYEFADGATCNADLFEQTVPESFEQKLKRQCKAFADALNKSN